MPDESKIEATDRLRREGRWTDASRFRDEERRRLKAEGMGRDHANEEAWRRMLNEFAPVAGIGAGGDASDGDLVDFVDVSAADAAVFAACNDPANFGRDFEWAYRNIGIPNVSADKAPSSGAWFMWQYGRQAKAKFMELALRYFTNPKREAEEQAKQEPKADLEKLKALITKAAGESAEKRCPSCGEVVP